MSKRTVLAPGRVERDTEGHYSDSFLAFINALYKASVAHPGLRLGQVLGAAQDIWEDKEDRFTCIEWMSDADITETLNRFAERKAPTPGDSDE